VEVLGLEGRGIRVHSAAGLFLKYIMRGFGRVRSGVAEFFFWFSRENGRRPQRLEFKMARPVGATASIGGYMMTTFNAPGSYTMDDGGLTMKSRLVTRGVLVLDWQPR
jgi:hypothetical protein